MNEQYTFVIPRGEIYAPAQQCYCIAGNLPEDQYLPGDTISPDADEDYIYLYDDL